MATHYSILAWRIPCTEEPGGGGGAGRGGYGPRDHKESDMTEQLTLSLHFSHFIGNVPRHHP